MSELKSVKRIGLWYNYKVYYMQEYAASTSLMVQHGLTSSEYRDKNYLTLADNVLSVISQSPQFCTVFLSLKKNKAGSLIINEPISMCPDA